MIEPCICVDQPGWLALREALWPHCSQAEHQCEMASFLAEPERYVQLLAYAEPGLAVGLAEASIRNDYVNGTETSPVAFLEGIYVAPEHRRRGVAGSLVRAVAEWARARGCAELASDAGINDEASHMAHKAFGFRETERVVFFNMALR